jgi:hypothetical protein
LNSKIQKINRILDLDFRFHGFLDIFGFWVSHPNPNQKPNFFWVRTPAIHLIFDFLSEFVVKLDKKHDFDLFFLKAKKK